MQLGPLGNAELDITSALGAQGSNATWGSAVFEYSNPAGGALLVETAVTQAAKTLAYTITSAERGASAADQHAVFWLPSAKAEVYIALQNTSATPLHVTGALEAPKGRTTFTSLTLGPSASQIVKALIPTGGGDSGRNADLYGAIVLSSDGPSGSLNTSGWIEDESTSFSTMMTFYDPGAHHGTNLFAPQVFVGKQTGLLASAAPLTIDSYLVVLNTSSTPLQPQAEFVFETGGQISQIPLYIGPLTPGQSAQVDIGDLQKQGIVSGNVSMGSVVIHYNGPEGALMGRVFGEANNPSYGFYVALETYAPASINEAYWTTAGDWNSFVTVANFGSQPDQISVEFTYNGGTFTLPKVRLRPLESVTLNVRQLTAGKLPSGVTYGGMRISGSSVHTSKLVVKEHVIGESEKVSRPFYNAPPYVYAFCIEDFNTAGCLSSIDMPLGGADQIFGNVFWSDGTVGVDYDTPSSSNTSVAPVTPGSYGWTWNVNGQNGGSSTITWISQSYPYDIYGDQQTWTAQVAAQVNGPDHVSVSLDNNGMRADCPAGTFPVQLRQMQMQVVDRVGRAITTNISVVEGFANPLKTIVPVAVSQRPRCVRRPLEAHTPIF